MEFIKNLSNTLYCIAVVVITTNSILDIYKHSKSEKTEDDKKKLKKCLGEELLVLVILSIIYFF